MKHTKDTFLKLLDSELSLAGFGLEEHLKQNKTNTNIKVLESELIKKVSGGRHEKTNADGSTSTTFIKAGPVTW